MSYSDDDLSAGGVLKTVNFIIESKLGWITWKETEAELYYYFERSYKATRCIIKLTQEETLFGVELDLPLDVLPRFEKAFKGTSMPADIDRIHGLDPALNYKRADAKLSRLIVSHAAPRPLAAEKPAISTLERKVNTLEIASQKDDLEIHGLIAQVSELQRLFQKRFDENEKKWEKRMEHVEKRCEVLEKTLGGIKK